MNDDKSLLRPDLKSPRFARIKKVLLADPLYLCIERATLITRYFRSLDNTKESLLIRKAKAFSYLLARKSALVFDDELLIGNVGNYRKSAIMQPELSSVFSCQELLWMDRRKTTAFKISWPDRLKLLFRVIPYWLPRNMIVRAFLPNFKHLFQYTLDQLNPHYYLINEAAGIGHFLPDYEKVVEIGIVGILNEFAEKSDDLSNAMRIAGEAVISYSNRLSGKAFEQAETEKDPQRKSELLEIARICQKVPQSPAETFHEALQSVWLCHLAVCLEGMNSAISMSRMDQYLFPYYKADLDSGRLTKDQAFDLLLCFCAKTTEHVFLISEKMSQYHGGFLTAQAITIGGMDVEGNDAVNDLSYLFLDVMKTSGLRDPNFHVRIHKNTPPEFTRRALDAARQGNGSPAFFCDETTISALEQHNYSTKNARDYAIVGCVEPTLPGRSFCSTDAALVNLPVCLELALNQGKRLKGNKQIGAITPDISALNSIDDIIAALKTQVEYIVARLIKDIQVIENGNRLYHPTPFSSMLVGGCIESGLDLTEGGASINSSGIQGVGIADVADSLAALDEVVFKKKKYSLPQLIETLKNDFAQEPKLQAELFKAPKFGNDHALPDNFADQVVQIFHSALSFHQNTCGGPYIPGFYSSTSHIGFGENTGALPSGRKAGTPFAASLSSVNGRDRLGPTAILNSVAGINADRAPNGYALNMSFDPMTVAGDKGLDLLNTLLKGYFENRGMELQLNVLDHGRLEEAYNNPGKHPGIVVRVAGYCAYFDDLPKGLKEEILNRNYQLLKSA